MSDWDWLTLDDDEEVLWESSPRLVTESDSLIRGAVMCITVILLPFGLLLMAAAYLRVQNREYIATNKKFYKKTGVFSVSTEESGIGNMQNFSYSQTYLGKMFNYGTVEISDASESITFTNVENPQEAKERLTEIANTHSDDSGDQSGSGSGVRSGDLNRLYRELQLANDAMEDAI